MKRAEGFYWEGPSTSEHLDWLKVSQIFILYELFLLRRKLQM